MSAVAAQQTTVGQATQATVAVSGRVTTASGSGISHATVTAEGGNTRLTTTTANDGTYTFALPPGLYTITVNHGGYQTASTDVTVLPGQPVAANVSMVEASLSNLQVIGRTTAGGGGAGNQARFNVSSSSDSQIGRQVIENRTTPDLTPLVNEIPGIDVYHSATNVNEDFIVRGFTYEAKTTLDGHPMSSGTGGTLLTQYTAAPLFGGVDVVKGAGLDGPIAGESGVGIVNIRTVDFTPKNSAFFQVGVDQFGGTQYTGLADINLGPKFSIIAGDSFSGYRGPTFGMYEPALDQSDGPSIPYYNNYADPTISNHVTEFDTDFSNTYSLDSQLIKARWKFSEASSITAEFLGLQGRFDPQGGAYGQMVGYETIPGCIAKIVTAGKTTYATPTACGTGTAAGVLPGVPGTAAGSSTTFLYNTPQFYNTPTAGFTTPSGPFIGQTIPTYTYYPGSDVRQNQPNFNLDLRTSIKNDTVLFRPYWAGIRRLIDGTQEANQPGDNGGWYPVTNNANCVATFGGETAAGASGPCFVPGSNPNNVGAYITDPNTPHSYGTVSALPGGYACSVATPCLTTPTAENNSAQQGYGSPYTTLEIDHLFGYTFSYIHPVGSNTYNLSLDHYFDDAQSFVNDFSTLEPGCDFTVGGTAAPSAASGLPGAQPTCTAFGVNGSGTTNTRPSPIGTPHTFSSITSLALTGQFQLTPALEFDWGNYFTRYTILAQQLNPAVVNLFAANGVSTSAIPLPGFTYNGVAYQSLIGDTLTASHYDPHFGLVFRPSRDLAFRFSGGSSLTIPYASQVSGFTKINQGATSTTVTTPNNQLLPEEVVALDLGADWRLHDGTVLSGDIYNDDVHNAWYSTTGPYTGPTIPALENTTNLFQSATYNVPELKGQGLEFSATNEPALGLGWRVTSSFKRNYYLGIGPSFFAPPPAAPEYPYNGEQLLGIPYARGYAEVQYAGPHGAVVRLGMDYEGSNNEYNFPAFAIFDAGVKLPVSRYGVTLGLSVENLTGINMGTNLARGLEYQGVDPVAAQIIANQYVYSLSTHNVGVIQPGFETFRLTLTKKL